MPKKIKVSLSGIVQQIDKVTEKLEAAKKSAAKAPMKKKLEIKIKKLKKIEKEVCALCRGMNPIPPTG